MKKLFDFFGAFFHSFPWSGSRSGEKDRKKQIDWKEIGRLRSKLQTMSTNRVERSNLLALAPAGGLSVNFRSLSSKVEDTRGLRRWFRADETRLVDEDNLAGLLAESKKSHRERQESGQYPVLNREDLARISQDASDMDAAAVAKLEQFLSGSSDDLGDLLCGTGLAGIVTNENVAVPEPLAVAELTPDDQPAEIETIPTSALDVVAKLEDTIKLDAVGHNDVLAVLEVVPDSEVEQISLVSVSAASSSKVTPFRRPSSKKKKTTES